mmetsp:Transcript_5201/g.6709  ORF Transcript_5201/g.6709 Transcript_5201/m.6709 type:complete len:155 (+) Transcript_5201:94-558(+)
MRSYLFLLLILLQLSLQCDALGNDVSKKQHLRNSSGKDGQAKVEKSDIVESPRKMEAVYYTDDYNKEDDYVNNYNDDDDMYDNSNGFKTYFVSHVSENYHATPVAWTFGQWAFFITALVLFGISFTLMCMLFWVPCFCPRVVKGYSIMMVKSYD